MSKPIFWSEKWDKDQFLAEKWDKHQYSESSIIVTSNKGHSYFIPFMVCEESFPLISHREGCLPNLSFVPVLSWLADQLKGCSWQAQPARAAWPKLGRAVGLAGDWEALEAKRAQKFPYLAYHQHCMLQHWNQLQQMLAFSPKYHKSAIAVEMSQFALHRKWRDVHLWEELALKCVSTWATLDEVLWSSKRGRQKFLCLISLFRMCVALGGRKIFPSHLKVTVSCLWEEHRLWKVVILNICNQF